MPEEYKTKFCSECGGSMNIKAKICPKCGVEQPIISKNVSNWWYIVSIFIPLIGGVIAWAVTKDRNPKKAIRFAIIGVAIPLIFMALVFSSTILFLLAPLF